MLAIILSPLYFAILYWACRRWYKLIKTYDIKNKALRFILMHCIWVVFLLTLCIAIGFLAPSGTLVKRIFSQIGSYWLGVSLYLILFLALFDLIRWIYSKIRKDHYNDRIARTISAILIVICTAITSLYGIINAKIVHTTYYEVTIHKDGGNLKELTIGLFGDPQFGYNIGEYHLQQAVDILNENNVDLVLVAGDVFDNEYSAIKDPDKLIELFHQINTKYGMYTVLGNHDVEEKILCGFTFNDDDIKDKLASQDMLDFLKKADLKLLYDDYITIEDSVTIYGRADYERPNLGNTTRKSAEEIAEEVDDSKPIIVLEHEPVEYDELEAAGVDLQLAGHTHDGQMWPAKIATDIIWKNPAGIYQSGNFTTITTSGLGLFGPNMRTGTIAEVCIVHITFEAD